MAGQTVRQVQECSDVVDGVLTLAGTAGVTLALEQEPLLIARKRTVINKATFRYAVAEGSALTVKLAKVANAVAPGTNTELSSAGDLDSTVDTNTELTITETANILEAGEMLIAKFSAVGSNLTGFALTVWYSEVIA